MQRNYREWSSTRSCQSKLVFQDIFSKLTMEQKVSVIRISMATEQLVESPPPFQCPPLVAVGIDLVPYYVTGAVTWLLHSGLVVRHRSWLSKVEC